MNKCTRCGEVNPAEIHTCTPRSKAQRLAEKLEQRGQTYDEAEVAAELRRLDDENYALTERKDHWMQAQIKTVAEKEKLAALNTELVAALEEAVYEIADWGGYASEYFQNKHDLKGVINKFQTLVAKAKEQP